MERKLIGKIGKNVDGDQLLLYFDPDTSDIGNFDLCIERDGELREDLGLYLTLDDIQELWVEANKYGLRVIK